MILERDFYIHPVQQVARDLLGCRLVRILDGKRVSGLINETEAYDGEQDLACHARNGKTRRNQVMYAAPGHAYVYFTYGIHWMLNCVAGDFGYPAAVLIRSVLPMEGLRIIQINRAGIPEKDWTNGPAKITRALQITGKLNGIDLTSMEDQLWIEEAAAVSEEIVACTARIGIDNTPEPWRSMPWRYVVKSEDWIQKGYNLPGNGEKP